MEIRKQVQAIIRDLETLRAALLAVDEEAAKLERGDGVRTTHAYFARLPEQKIPKISFRS